MYNCVGARPDGGGGTERAQQYARRRAWWRAVRRAVVENAWWFVVAALVVLALAVACSGCCYGEAARNAELARAGRRYFEAAGPDFARVVRYTEPAPGLDAEDRAALERLEVQYARALESMRRLFGGEEER